jgi:hypothetical protein
MRGLLVIVSVVALLTIGVGVTVSVRQARGGSASSPTATSQQGVGGDATATLAPGTAATGVGNPGDTATATIAPTLDPALPLLNPAKPTWAALTEGLARTRDYYSETHQVDVFTVRWRPGAFPAEKADQVAGLARTALDHDNALLGLSDNGPIEILLADQMFAQECLGCQGFAAADLRQIFILQDGSVADDELPSLLAHEIGHVLAANYISLPKSLFFAEGLATWVMSDDIAAAGYVTPLQSAAWALKAGMLPPLSELREGDFAGRMRARLEYDPAGAFTIFAVQVYGMPAYERLYAQEAPEDVVGKTWDQIEAEWHTWLGQYADATFNGVDGVAWWQAAQTIIGGYVTLYDDPDSVSQEQYAYLATSRLALNRADLPNALALAAASGLIVTTAQ